MRKVEIITTDGMNAELRDLLLFLTKSLKDECVRKSSDVHRLKFTIKELSKQLHLKDFDQIISLLECANSTVIKMPGRFFSIIQSVHLSATDEIEVEVVFGDGFVPYAQQTELDEFSRILCERK